MEEKTKKCVCREELCIGGAEVEIGGVCHRPNNPCYIIENQTNNRIREEFYQKFQEIEIRIPEIEAYYDGKKASDTVADWWLSKIDELLKSQKESLVEKIEHQFYGANNPKVIDIINLIKEDK